MNSNNDGGHAQGYSYLSLRGAGQARINMTLNGVPLNEPEDHGVYTSNYPSFITSIQSIQIQRGVGTSSNGSASFIGSINMQSKNGFIKGTEIQLGGGSYNTERINVSTSTGLNNKNLALFINVGGIKTDGFRHNSGSTGGSVFASGGYFGRKRVTKLVFFTGTSKNKMAWDGSDESNLKTDFRDNPRGNDNTDLFNQTHLQLHNINVFNTSSKLTTTLFYNHLSGHYDVYSMKDLPVIGYYAFEKQHSDWYGYIMQYDYKFFDVNFTAGLSLNTYKRNHSGIEYYDSTTTFQYKNNGVKDEGSGFIKLNLGNRDVREYLDLQVRCVDFKYHGDVPLAKQSWTFFNPKVGIKIMIDKNIDMYYAIGISHREPTRSVLFNGGFYLTTLNDVKAEKVIDFEFGTNIKTERLKLQADLFGMSFRDEIIPAGPMGSNSLPTMINVPNSSRVGLELDGEYDISNSIEYDANFTLSKSEFGDSARQQLFNPKVILNESLKYTKNRFSVSINQTYYSKSYIDITNTYSVSGYLVFGTNVSYSFKNYNLSLQGNNLTNKKFYSNGYALGDVRYLFPNALANYYATLRIKL